MDQNSDEEIMNQNRDKQIMEYRNQRYHKENYH